jgi:NAD(P)H dehydrogenase (quinone)
MNSTQTILVTGATGTHGGVGGHLVRKLVRDGLSVRALVHAEDHRAERLRRAGAAIVVGDFLKLATLRPAFQGIKRALFCFPLAEGLMQATANLCVAAREASVDTVVNLSLMMAAEDHPSPVCRDHWLSERILDWAEVGAIHLRGGFFYENLIRFTADLIAREDRVVLPFGDGDARLAWVGAIDMARVAAAILANPDGHIGQTYEITGETTLSIKDIVDLMSKGLDRTISYSNSPLPEWIDSIKPILGSNMQLRNHVSVLAMGISSGRVIGRTNTNVEQITGRPPQGFARFVAEHATRFRQ